MTRSRCIFWQREFDTLRRSVRRAMGPLITTYHTDALPVVLGARRGQSVSKAPSLPAACQSCRQAGNMVRPPAALEPKGSKVRALLAGGAKSRKYGCYLTEDFWPLGSQSLTAALQKIRSCRDMSQPAPLLEQPTPRFSQ